METPDAIMEKEYEYIVIANAEQGIKEEIREFLLRLGVEEEKLCSESNRRKGRKAMLGMEIENKSICNYLCEK